MTGHAGGQAGGRVADPAGAPEPHEALPTRRTVLKWSGAAGMLGITAWVAPACIPPDQSGPSAGLALLSGFTARVIARGGQVVPNTSLGYRWAPDGAATFVDPAVAGGWYLAVNHENLSGGGVTSIRFAPDGTITGAASILSGTSMNCAGGATPWGTWLSCEEFDTGRVYECDPTGAAPAQVRPALGAFAHEAAAVAADGRVYLTEDRSDGGFYRFTPDTPGDLSSGLLEIATGAAPGTLTWVTVPDPSAASTLCRYQVPASTEFNGGEGIDTLGTDVWFTTKGDKRVWHYDTATAAVSIRYQAGSGTLNAVDNLWVDDASSNLFVAEDGGNMEVVMLRPDNTTVAVARVPSEDWSEITGPCFSPDGQRLYFSSQRGSTASGLSGVTYEVSGPFDTLLGRP